MEKKEIFRMLKGSGEPPVCAAPEEVLSAVVGMPFSIDIVASDPGGQITAVQGVNLPEWAMLNTITELPSPDAIVRISGTPGADNEGLQVLSLVVTNSDETHSATTLKINVADYGFRDEQPGVF